MILRMSYNSTYLVHCLFTSSLIMASFNMPVYSCNAYDMNLH
jgi:hypothetical protein